MAEVSAGWGFLPAFKGDPDIVSHFGLSSNIKQPAQRKHGRLAPEETPEIKPSASLPQGAQSPERRLTGQCAWGFRQNVARPGWPGSRTGPRWVVEVTEANLSWNLILFSADGVHTGPHS